MLAKVTVPQMTVPIQSETVTMDRIRDGTAPYPEWELILSMD